MRLALFYDDSPGTVGFYFLKAFQSLGHTIEHFPTSEADRCPGGYQAYLRVDHGDYSYDLPDRFRPRAFYIVDTHLAKSWRSIRRQARRYDVLFCVQRRAIASLRHPRAFWTPLACDLDLHSGSDGGSPAYDIAFVGNDGGVPRKFYLQELRERYPKSFIGRALYTKMAEIYSRAKIGFHYIEYTSPFSDMISMRVFEVLAAQRLLVANALGAGDYEALGLRDRQELVLYRNPLELFEVLDYYLQHEDECEQIAAAGRRCVLARHTYQHRAQVMVDVFREHLNV